MTLAEAAAEADALAQAGDERALAQLSILLVGLGDAIEQLNRVALGCAVPEADDREAPDGDVGITRREIVEQRTEGVDVARVIS
jgi:hypothetical protein